jgi:hypothetical protein
MKLVFFKLFDRRLTEGNWKTNNADGSSTNSVVNQTHQVCIFGKEQKVFGKRDTRGNGFCRYR